MTVPRYTREIPQRYRLEAGRCEGCGKVSFPPRQVCPSCGGRKQETIRLEPSGTILSYTAVHVAAEEFDTGTPFVVAVVETPEGARLTAQVADCDPSEVAIGKKVRLELRRVREEGKAGILQYGYTAVLGSA
ncbi:MAG: Zn-ribbon domain-containing OB-fold protein [bacterium]